LHFRQKRDAFVAPRVNSLPEILAEMVYVPERVMKAMSVGCDSTLVGDPTWVGAGKQNPTQRHGGRRKNRCEVLGVFGDHEVNGDRANFIVKTTGALSFASAAKPAYEECLMSNRSKHRADLRSAAHFCYKMETRLGLSGTKFWSREAGNC
jgi:hypothetical protein